jgi:unsaturated chondroitin disaccharide hydrolase
VNTSTLKTANVVQNAHLQRAFDLCIRKSRQNIQRLADAPKAAPWAVDGNYFVHPEGFNELGNWTSSFLTGMALIAWRETEDEFFLQQLQRLAPAYRDKAFNAEFHSHHDMGFLYSLYSVALYKLTGDKQHREVGLAAAEALARRFNSKGNFIRAWGRLGTDEFANMAIIDCMMNLPLLFWAAQESGDEKFRDLAVHSADTTLKCFIRADDSVYHAFRFDLKTGQPVGGDNYCGRDVETHWARGTGWAIYGFAIAHRYTGDKKYLDASLRLARKFNRELDGDPLPVWDFKLPAGEPPLRDTSAAAVVICGYQELEKLGAADTLISKTKESLMFELRRELSRSSERRASGCQRPWLGAERLHDVGRLLPDGSPRPRIEPRRNVVVNPVCESNGRWKIERRKH